MSRIIVGAYAAVLFAGPACGDASDGESSTAAVAAPTALKVEFLEGGAHLTWKDNSDNESEFMIERKSGSSSWSTLASVPFDTTQYHDADLTTGTEYSYRVMAMPKSGGHDDGAFSNEVDFVAPEGAGGGAGAAGSGEHTGHDPGAAGS